ncbi:uncharacterized protein At1g21580 [Malania oleifera]|uniref:uncharacterized protein At1g21580 n=1 Tax=Malania oleifera TaxID=397392 RepID=UPI0025ADCE58|nr:uncharacterized protein At1g21580 [Malania oleifera]
MPFYQVAKELSAVSGPNRERERAKNHEGRRTSLIAMDLPSFNHHHHHHHHHHPRYVPMNPPIPPPPGPPPALAGDPPIYAPPHVHIHPPPPQQFPPPLPPPPPLQPSFRHLPPPLPPSPYDSFQTQFTFLNPGRPIDDDSTPHHHHHHHPDFAHSSKRSLFDDDRRFRVPEFGTDLRNRSRVMVPPDDRLFEDPEPHFRPFNHGSMSSYRTIDSFRHESEPAFRFRVNHDDRFDQNQREEVVWGRSDSRGDDHGRRGQFILNSNGASTDFEFDNFNSASLLMDYADNLGNYDSRYGLGSESELFRNDRGDGVSERQRWGHTHVRHDFELGNKQNGDGDDDGDGFWVASGKRMARTLESGKYNSRGDREGGGEFDRTPRKKSQKKSVLLRLQKPTARNRNGEHSAAYFDDSQPSSFRGKDTLMYSDHRVEEERVGSPVELDVSFRSNVLVAKPIAASLNPTVVSARTLNPRNRKFRKVTEPNRDSSNLQLTILNESPANSDSLTHADHQSCSNNGLEQSEDKVEVSGNETACDCGPQSGSSRMNASVAKSAVKGSEKDAVSDVGGPIVGSDGTSSARIRKKKKVMTPLLCLSKSEQTEKHDESVNADGSANSPSAASGFDKGVMHSKETNASVRMVNKCEVVLNDNKVDDKKGSTDADPFRSCARKINRKRSKAASPSSVSDPEKTKTNEGSVNADIPTHLLHTFSNFDKGSVSVNDGTTCFDIGSMDEISELSFQNGTTTHPENGNVKGFLETLPSVDGNVNASLLSAEEFKIHDSTADTYSSGLGMKTIMSSDYDLVSTVDACSKHSCSNDFGILLENGIMEESQKDAYSEGGNATLGLSNFDEMRTSGDFLSIDNHNHSGSENGSSHPQQKHTSCNVSTVDDTSKLLCLDGVIALPVKNVIEVSAGSGVSAGTNLDIGHDEEHIPKTERERKVGTPRSNLSSSRTSNTCVGPVNVVTPSVGVDTASACLDQNSNLVEQDVTASGFGCLDVVSQPCADGAATLHGNNSIKGFNGVKVSMRDGANVVSNGTSPKYKKKRKFHSPRDDFSPTVPVISRRPENAGTLTYAEAVPSNFNGGLTKPEEKVALSAMGTLSTACLLPCPEGITVSPENCLTERSSGVMGFARDGFNLDCSTLEGPSTGSCSIQESTTQNLQFLCLSGFESGQKENATPVTATNIHQNDIMDMDGMFDQSRISSELQNSALDQRLPSTNMDCDSSLLLKDDLPSACSYFSLCAEGDAASTPDRGYELGSSPNAISNTGSVHEDELLGQTSAEEVCGSDNKLDESPILEVDSTMITQNSLSQDIKIDSNFVHATENDDLIQGESVPSHSQDTKKTAVSLNSMTGESNGHRNQLSYAVPRVLTGRSTFVLTNSKKAVSSSSMANSRTWHRTTNHLVPPLPGKKSFSSSIPLQKQLPKKSGKSESTYIRKGNSLVRKPASVPAFPRSAHGLSTSVYQMNPTNMDEMKKSMGSESRVSIMGTSKCLRMDGANASFERPKTPPLQHGNRLSNCTTIPSGDCTASMLENPHSNDGSENKSDLSKLTESKHAPKYSEDAPKSSTAENSLVSINSVESANDGAINDANLMSSKNKKIIYVKRKSNQLVAASNLCDPSIHSADKTPTLFSDGYYKRNNNQLVRTSMENQNRKKVAVSGDSSNSEGQMAPKVISSRNSDRKRSDKGIVKKCKPSKLSLVWTLSGTQSFKKDGYSLQREKVLPHLFPWKRATFLRSFIRNPSSNNRSLSMISNKLLFLRKRDTVYTRSPRGFSLRKSKVLSIGGSSLKWSKSIERRSKKANEEATLAVVEVERKKREQNVSACVVSQTRSRNHSSRARIFRIGSVRYKMDSSGRTLQRISDEESSYPTAIQPENDVKKSYVPRRLLIGNEEYVRIGNGNQLIRDPKKRTRILASEKVRWSLHTARLRLARKWKYCQFYTRFGKCNKDNGKCPYIHDPSKIAVCTKFLNGLCSNRSCKLTHKVIPERMPDCSYFLQGLCSNENCPYRHVNVNPNASICESFLRGYCADGDECRKKHTYVCPNFEATGVCSQGSKCKLHHPKNRSRGKKRKRSIEQTNARGRYFGSINPNIAETAVAVSEKHTAHNNEIFLEDGRLADYISLDVSDDEARETEGPMSEQTAMCDDEPSDAQLDNLDQLIKPIRIMYQQSKDNHLR